MHLWNSVIIDSICGLLLVSGSYVMKIYTHKKGVSLANNLEYRLRYALDFTLDCMVLSYIVNMTVVVGKKLACSQVHFQCPR